ncbi:hypothetical protein IX51_04070 [uncultured archaeon]|nr:hypothetical protein IX51_04070 [uncultured archaeon]
MDNAVVLAEGVFGTTYGKTANGLVRYSTRFRIKAVIDSRFEGKDAGMILSGKTSGIPVVSGVEQGLLLGADTLVIGVATDGGFIPETYRQFISDALKRGMNVVSGLHEFIGDDQEFSELALSSGSRITDVRRLFRDLKIPFTGKIEEVRAKKIAILGTDSAIGKRTTSVFLTREMNMAGHKSVMVGTGQTSWMQGFKYTVVVDSMINDFVPGALEEITYQAWVNEKPEYIFIEGQGSVLHPAYPGSFEIIGACRPDGIILQHAPARKYFDGFGKYRIPDLGKYVRILEELSDRRVIAIALNTENMTRHEVIKERNALERRFGIPVFDPLGKLLNVTREISVMNL